MSELSRLKDADGLSQDERDVVEQLVWQLSTHAGHNRLVRSYYDQDFSVSDPIFQLQIASDRIRDDWVTGWATKAVDALAARVRLDGFAALDGRDEPR